MQGRWSVIFLCNIGFRLLGSFCPAPAWWWRCSSSSSGCIILVIVLSIYSCEIDNTFHKHTPNSKGSVRRFSNFSRSCSIKPKEYDYNSVQQYSKDVLDFLNNNNLKPVYIYENLSKKFIENKVLNDTRNIAGVYLILNKATLSCYVGSASTNKLNARLRKHLYNFSSP